MRPSGARLVLLAAGLLASGLAVAQNASIDSIRAAIESGENSLAVQRADQRLAEHADDAQARFLKACALAASGADAAALSIFSQLRSDYPERVDVANNLGVVLARVGQLSDARAALESARVLAPDDTAVRRNLGDVYLALAQRAYAAAGAQGAKRGSRLDDVLPALEDIGHPVVDGPVASARQTAIVQVLRDRAAARANSDFQAWLASYSDHFTPADGQSRADWLTAVRKTFDEPGKPGGPIEDVRVVFNAPDRAHASYRQPGHAGSVIRHAVAFVQEDGQWRIVSQRESALGFETL